LARCRCGWAWAAHPDRFTDRVAHVDIDGYGHAKRHWVAASYADFDVNGYVHADSDIDGRVLPALRSPL